MKPQVHLLPASSAAPSPPSGWAAVPTAARGTRSSRRSRRRSSRAARRRRWAAVRRTSTRTSIRWSPSGWARASASSIACSAAGSCRDRSSCSAASRASASPRCCCRRPRTSRPTSGRSCIARARSRSIRSSCAASGSASGSVPLYLLAETCVERLMEEVARLKPALLIVDSIQTVFSLKLPSAPGSVGQVRQAATDLLFAAKGRTLPTILVGHVTKDGSLAGPEGPRARRRHRAVLRRRAAALAPGRARREESLWRGERARRLRDDRRRPARRSRIRRRCFSPSGRRTCRARPCCARSKDRGRFWSKCRRSSARRRSATRGAPRADSIRTGSRCCSP